MIRGVMFDLDDTLIEHRRCASAARGQLHRADEAFGAGVFEELAHADGQCA